MLFFNKQDLTTDILFILVFMAISIFIFLKSKDKNKLNKITFFGFVAWGFGWIAADIMFFKDIKGAMVLEILSPIIWLSSIIYVKFQKKK